MVINLFLHSIIYNYSPNSIALWEKFLTRSHIISYLVKYIKEQEYGT
jgi:hypothetical protein